MKFGSDRAAKSFGFALAQAFARACPAVFDRPAVVVPAPSSTVTIASKMLADHFRSALNIMADEMGKPMFGWSMINRDVTYKHDYADQTPEERERMIQGDVFCANEAYLDGKILLFVDDITVTGSHMTNLMRFLEKRGMDNERCFVTLAAYNGPDPSIEGRLNHIEIRDATDLARLSHEKNFKVTTRALRLFYAPAPEDFAELLDSYSSDKLEAFFQASIVSEYGYHDAFRTNFDFLKSRLATRAHIAAASATLRKISAS